MAQHKIVSLLKTFVFSSVVLSVCVFTVWPKPALLLPVWPREPRSWTAGRAQCGDAPDGEVRAAVERGDAATSLRNDTVRAEQTQEAGSPSSEIR